MYCNYPHLLQSRFVSFLHAKILLIPVHFIYKNEQDISFIALSPFKVKQRCSSNNFIAINDN
jgi:hypothetical protein